MQRPGALEQKRHYEEIHPAVKMAISPLEPVGLLGTIFSLGDAPKALCV
jgi:hypothetical protein